jgi:hypothetical protein
MKFNTILTATLLFLAVAATSAMQQPVVRSRANAAILEG